MEAAQIEISLANNGFGHPRGLTILFLAGLGLFGRLAPPGMAAAPNALGLPAAFFGNLLAGALGMLWAVVCHPQYFLVLSLAAGASGFVPRTFDRAARQVDNPASATALPEPLAIL